MATMSCSAACRLASPATSARRFSHQAPRQSPSAATPTRLTPTRARVPLRPGTTRPAGRAVPRVVAQAWGNDGKPDIADRVVASIPYVVPLLDSLRFGKFVFRQLPAAAALLGPLEPLIKLYFGFPFASLIVFFAIYIGIINNQQFSRYVRFNAMQAILLDIVLIFPGLLESIIRPPMGGPGLQLYISAYNTIFFFVVACVAFGVGNCVVGLTARLPLVADAADAQIR